MDQEEIKAHKIYKRKLAQEKYRNSDKFKEKNKIKCSKYYDKNADLIRLKSRLKYYKKREIIIGGKIQENQENEKIINKLNLDLENIKTKIEDLQFNIQHGKKYNKPKCEDYEETIKLTGSGITVKEPIRKKIKFFL